MLGERAARPGQHGSTSVSQGESLVTVSGEPTRSRVSHDPHHHFLGAGHQKEAFLTTVRLALGLTQDLVMTFCDFS